MNVDDAITRRLPEEDSGGLYFGLEWSVFEEMLLEAYTEVVTWEDGEWCPVIK